MKTVFFLSIDLNLRQCQKCMEEGNEECVHSYTNILHNHKAVNYCLIIVDRYYQVFFEKIYTGEDAVENFLRTLLDLEQSIRDYASRYVEMAYDAEAKVIFFSLFYYESLFCYM